MCCVGTFINCMSKWLDHWPQKLKPYGKGYIYDSGQVLKDLDKIDEVPSNAMLFSADTQSVHTNIDTQHQ